MDRKLSAVVVADVVGYSRLMGADEEGTLLRVQADIAEVFRPAIATHHGRLVKTTGDGLLVEFVSAVDAVRCAVAVQQAMAARNAGYAPDRRVEFRIGINVGDLIVAGEDIYGDGVNIAARVQSLADPGGTVLSGTAFDQVNHKLDVAFEYLGEHAVKNIADPVRLYRLGSKSGVANPAVPREIRRRPARQWMYQATIAAGVAVAMAAAVVLWLQRWPRDAPSVSDLPPALELPDRPSIAVLPFTSMSDDPSQEYFADGMTEDLITDLAKMSGLFVIARNSSFIYKGKTVDIVRVGAELGVQYVLEGSVRRSGDRVRINAQLIDAKTGGHLWAERYDSVVADVFAVQDDVTRNIAAALAINLIADAAASQPSRETTVPAAYDAFLQGWAHYQRTTPADFAKAIPFFKSALLHDPDFARAYAALAGIYWRASDRGWADELGVSKIRAINLAKQYLLQAMKEPSSTAEVVSAAILLDAGGYDEALAALGRAIALDPSDSIAYANMALVHVLAGQPAAALTDIEKAIRMDPHYPPYYLGYRGRAEFGLDRFADAAATFEEATRRNQEDLWPFIWLVSSYGHLRQSDDAARTIAQVDGMREHSGGGPFTVLWASNWSFREPHDLDRLLAGLRKAGVPELPFGYDAASKDRLSGAAIRATLFGHAVEGGDLQAGQTYRISFDGSGIASRSGAWGTDNGGIGAIEGDRLCIQWPRYGRSCSVLFHQPQGASVHAGDYIWISPSTVFEFSVVE